MVLLFHSIVIGAKNLHQDFIRKSVICCDCEDVLYSVQCSAVLSTYLSTPHVSKRLSPYCMVVYGVEMTIPINLVIGEVVRQWNDVHCPVEYVKWLCYCIRDAHDLTRAILRKL